MGTPSESTLFLSSLQDANNWELLEKESKRLLQESPEEASWHYYRGTALTELKRYKEALPHIQQCLKESPNDTTYITLAVI